MRRSGKRCRGSIKTRRLAGRSRVSCVSERRSASAGTPNQEWWQADDLESLEMMGERRVARASLHKQPCPAARALLPSPSIFVHNTSGSPQFIHTVACLSRIFSFSSIKSINNRTQWLPRKLLLLPRRLLLPRDPPMPHTKVCSAIPRPPRLSRHGRAVFVLIAALY